MLPLLLFLAFLSAPADLEKNVKLYWDALMVADKASALNFVHPDDLNNFINRREARFESWKLLDTEMRSENEAVVRIQLQRVLANGVVGPVKGRETWVKFENEWRVRVMPAGEQYRALLARKPASESKQPATKSSELEIRPTTLTFYGASPRQPSFIHVWNGLDTSVDIVEIVIDSDRFQILQSPETLAAHSAARVKLQYTGDDTGENLKSEILLRLRQEDQIREFTIPVVYNYMDEISRWLQRKKQVQKP
jgi:hypothetical protein